VIKKSYSLYFFFCLPLFKNAMSITQLADAPDQDVTVRSLGLSLNSPDRVTITQDFTFDTSGGSFPSTMIFTKIADFVVVSIASPGILNIGGAGLLLNLVNLPVETGLRPASTQRCPYYTFVNGLLAQGSVVMVTDGSIQFYPPGGGDFVAAAGATGADQGCFTYSLV
jgi:hypothetical protein